MINFTKQAQPRRSLVFHPIPHILARRSDAKPIAAVCRAPKKHINAVSVRFAGYFFNVTVCSTTKDDQPTQAKRIMSVPAMKCLPSLPPPPALVSVPWWWPSDSVEEEKRPTTGPLQRVITKAPAKVTTVPIALA